MKNRKILIYSLIVFILAGIIVVLLKGFNVDLMLRSHESIEYTADKEINLNEIKEICKEVFKEKEVRVRIVEVFNDTVSINVAEITEEEKNNIVNKLNEKYEKEEDPNNIEIILNPGLRIRQIIKPYIFPTIITMLFTYIFYIIRFYKGISKNWKKIIESIIITVFIDLSILSLIAIVRIPMNTMIIPILVFVSIFSTMIYFEKEKNNIIIKKKKEKNNNI